MKALINIYIGSKPVSLNRYTDIQLDDIKNSVDEWLKNHIKDAYSDFKKYSIGLAFGIDGNFLYRYGHKKIQIYPENMYQDFYIEFQYGGESDWICNCKEIECDGGCGTLKCGCIDICRGRCGNYDNRYGSYNSY